MIAYKIYKKNKSKMNFKIKMSLIYTDVYSKFAAHLFFRLITPRNVNRF